VSFREHPIPTIEHQTSGVLTTTILAGNANTDAVVVKIEGIAENIYLGKIRYTIRASAPNAIAKGRR
jgi:hypothetical protein